MAEIGSIAELISGGANVAALVAASFAAVAAFRTTRQQAEQLDRLEDEQRQRTLDRRREQADAIAVWMGIYVDSGKPRVAWLNGSGLPVYDVTVYATPTQKLVKVRYTTLGPTGEPPAHLMPRVEAALNSDENATWEEMLARGTLRAAISFKDVSGRWWFRDFFGHLTERSDRHDCDSAAIASAATITWNSDT